MEEKNRTTKEAPKTLMDRNASWPLTVVYLGFLVGIYLGQMATTRMFKANYNSYAYYFVAIFAGIIGTFFVYNLGKIIAAKFCHYDLVYIKIIGLMFDFTKEKTKVSFNIMDVFSLRMEFAPKEDKLDANPKGIFFGGLIAEAVLMVLALVFFFVFGLNGTQTGSYFFAWGFLFAVCYGFLTPLYELIPLRQDYPTDMFNVMATSKEEDRKAFNLYKINHRRELTGEDYLLPEFSDYDGYYKAHCIYYVYLSELYESKLQKASATLDEMKYFAKYFDEGDEFITPSEVVYLKYLVGDSEGARKAYLAIKKDDRKAVTAPTMLSLYRIAIFILIDINADKEAVAELVKQFNDIVASYGENKSRRVEKEILYFNSAYKKAAALKPELGLEIN